MAEAPLILIPKKHQSAGGYDPIDAAAEEAARSGVIPIQIKCPECARVYSLFIKDFDQGMHTLLGQACPYCKRFLTEKDDPEKILADLPEIRKLTEGDTK